MRIFGFILLYLILLGCDDPENVNAGKSITYGTSFGMCVGYCITETEISGNSLLIESKGWTSNVDAKNASVEISDKKVRDIWSGIDLDEFAGLPEIIGCPDCADGGAEWLELEVNGELKKVTFEYRDDIEGISPAVKLLRELTEEYNPVE